MAMTTETHATFPVEHNPLASMPHDSHGGISNVVLGMLLFITSEVMFFGGLFAAYFSLRANAPMWPPINPESGEAFLAPKMSRGGRVVRQKNKDRREDDEAALANEADF